MVAAHDIGVDGGGFDFIFEWFGYQEIIDAPADIALAGVGEVAPPAVVAIALLKHPQRVGKAAGDEAIKPAAFLFGEALFAAIGLGVGQVVLGVGDIQVAAEDHRLGVAVFAGFELLAIRQKGRIPGLAQRNAAEVVLGIRRINGYYPELLKFSGHDAAFFVWVAVSVTGYLVLVDYILRKAVDDLQRRGFAKNGRAAVAWLVGGVPKLGVAGHIEADLVGLSLGFLNTQDIRLFPLDKWLPQAFFDDGADAVHVPGVEFDHVTIITSYRSVTMMPNV